MLVSILWVIFAGFLAGQLATKLKAPALIGMILWGITIGPQGLNRLSGDFLDQAIAFRTIAVMAILAKAGLGLDREKLRQQGSVALRLGLLPAVCETLVIAIASQFLFQLDMTTGLLLGCVLAAESPAVIVPGMLWLKQKGWGVAKGIPDAILTGSALSDVLVLLVFNLVLNQFTQSAGGGVGFTPVVDLMVQVAMQIGGGILLGLVVAQGLSWILQSPTWIKNTTQATLVTSCLALGLVVLARQRPVFSGYLAVMVLGFHLANAHPPQARRLRQGFNALWAIAQIILFVLLGANIQLNILGQSLLPGLLLLILGTVLGRGCGWYLSTLGSNWSFQERLYLLPGNSAKATVQAAIGAIPLAAGVPGGDIILALSALSILVTAPLGAWAIPFFARRLLSQDEVDPTKVLQEPGLHLLVGLSQSSDVVSVLKYAAHLARVSDGRVSLISLDGEAQSCSRIQQQAHRILADIPNQWSPQIASSLNDLSQIAQRLNVDQMVMGQDDTRSQYQLERISTPILVVPRTDVTG